MRLYEYDNIDKRFRERSVASYEYTVFEINGDDSRKRYFNLDDIETLMSSVDFNRIPKQGEPLAICLRKIRFTRENAEYFMKRLSEYCRTKEIKLYFGYSHHLQIDALQPGKDNDSAEFCIRRLSTVFYGLYFWETAHIGCTPGWYPSLLTRLERQGTRVKGLYLTGILVADRNDCAAFVDFFSHPLFRSIETFIVEIHYSVFAYEEISTMFHELLTASVEKYTELDLLNFQCNFLTPASYLELLGLAQQLRKLKKLILPTELRRSNYEGNPRGRAFELVESRPMETIEPLLLQLNVVRFPLQYAPSRSNVSSRIIRNIANATSYSHLRFEHSEAVFPLMDDNPDVKMFDTRRKRNLLLIALLSPGQVSRIGTRAWIRMLPTDILRSKLVPMLQDRNTNFV
jgi:hypothetical protein